MGLSLRVAFLRQVALHTAGERPFQLVLYDLLGRYAAEATTGYSGREARDGLTERGSCPLPESTGALDLAEATGLPARLRRLLEVALCAFPPPLFQGVDAGLSTDEVAQTVEHGLHVVDAATEACAELLAEGVLSLEGLGLRDTEPSERIRQRLFGRYRLVRRRLLVAYPELLKGVRAGHVYLAAAASCSICSGVEFST